MTRAIMRRYGELHKRCMPAHFAFMLEDRNKVRSFSQPFASNGKIFDRNSVHVYCCCCDVHDVELHSRYSWDAVRCNSHR